MYVFHEQNLQIKQKLIVEVQQYFACLLKMKPRNLCNLNLQLTN